ncbi:MAG: hypothetical protein N2595_02870 [bacterium]|nr:hypothetical protein [bacterium]
MDQKSLIQLANERAFAQLEERWIEALASATDQLDELLKVPAWLVKARQTDLAETLLATLLEALHEQHQSAALLSAAQHALSLFPDNPSFRSFFVSALTAAHPENPLASRIASASGIAQGAPLNHCLEFIAQRIHIRPGFFALHRMRRLPVRIEAYDPFSDTLTLSDGSETFSASFRTFSDQYEPLDESDFRAMSVFCRPALEQLAQHNPAELTIRYLKAYGRSSTFRDFKEALTKSAVPPHEWKAWWSRAKPILLNHPLVELGEGSQPSLTLRDSPRQASLSWRTEFSFATHPRIQPAIVLRYTALLADGVSPDPELVELFYTGLASESETPPARAFAAWLALSVLARVLASTPPPYAPSWLSTPDARKQFAQWCSWEPIYMPHFTATLPQVDPNWPLVFATTLPYAPIALVENIVCALRASGHQHLLTTALSSLSTPTVENAEAFAWLWRTLATDPSCLSPLSLDLEAATLTLFRLIQQLGVLRHVGELNVHAALATLRHTLATKHYDLIRSVLRRIGSQRAADWYQLVMSNTGLSPAMRAQLVAIVSDTAASR